MLDFTFSECTATPQGGNGVTLSERVGREKLLLRCRLLGRARRFGAHGGGVGRGHTVAAARLQLIVCCCRSYGEIKIFI